MAIPPLHPQDWAEHQVRTSPAIQHRSRTYARLGIDADEFGGAGADACAVEFAADECLRPPTRPPTIAATMMVANTTLNKIQKVCRRRPHTRLFASDDTTESPVPADTAPSEVVADELCDLCGPRSVVLER